MIIADEPVQVKINPRNVGTLTADEEFWLQAGSLGGLFDEPEEPGRSRFYFDGDCDLWLVYFVRSPRSREVQAKLYPRCIPRNDLPAACDILYEAYSVNCMRSESYQLRLRHLRTLCPHKGQQLAA